MVVSIIGSGILRGKDRQVNEDMQVVPGCAGYGLPMSEVRHNAQNPDIVVGQGSSLMRTEEFLAVAKSYLFRSIPQPRADRLPQAVTQRQLLLVSADDRPFE